MFLAGDVTILTSKRLSGLKVLLILGNFTDVCTLQLTSGGDAGQIGLNDFQSKMPPSPAPAGGVKVCYFLQRYSLNTWSKE